MNDKNSVFKTLDDRYDVQKMVYENMMKKVFDRSEYLKSYLETMSKVTERAMAEDRIIHGYMVYQCEECGKVYIMNLEEGLEDPTWDKATGEHKPVPYCITCICCGGQARHIMWNLSAHTYGKNYRSYREMVNTPNEIIFRNFFYNDPESSCGEPIVFEPDFDMAGPNGFGKRINFVGVDEFCQILDNPEVVEKLVEQPKLSPFDLLPDEALGLDTPRNRKQRRHGVDGKDGYKRPRKNKKLYEY